MELCFASGPCSIATASPPLVQTATFDWHLAAPPQVPAGALLLHVDASAAPGLIAITNRAVSRGAACGTPLSAHPSPTPPRSKQTSSLPAATSPVPPSAQPIARPKPMPGPVFELKFHSVPFLSQWRRAQRSFLAAAARGGPFPLRARSLHLRRLQCPPAPPTLRALYTMLRFPAPRSPGPGSVFFLPAMESFPCSYLL